MRSAFSLVELSIVLVILGLLTGGILAGQSLIRASELRAVSSEYQRYYAALQSFRDKYFAVPGDFKDATRFWGRGTATADCVTNSAAAVNAGTGSCDGDGNSQLAFPGAASQSGEVFQYWRHLANAGLIEGNYTGVAGSGGAADATFGTNIPKSKLTNGAWSTAYYAGLLDGSSGTDFTGVFDLYFVYGAKLVNDYNWSAVLKPEELWNIDTKLDDGKPGTGKLLAHPRNTCANATSATDYAATYQLSSTSVVCKFYITRQ